MIHVKILNFEGNNFSSLSFDDVETFKSTGIVFRKSRTGQNLTLNCCSQSSAAILWFRFPSGTETFAFNAPVWSEFHYHEIRCSHVRLVCQIRLLARNSCQWHWFLFCASANKNLNGVESLFGIEFLELQDNVAALWAFKRPFAFW